MSLTDKQKAFCEHYMQSWNATDAARKAGYSGTQNTLAVVGYENLNKPVIKDYIERLKKDIHNESTIDIGSELFSLLVDTFGDIKTAQKAIRLSIHSLIEDIDSKQELIKLRRENFNKETRYAILHRAGFKCQACGAKPNKDNDVNLQIDHIIPVSWGGSNDSENLQVLCSDCNYSKGNRYMFDHNKDNQLNIFPDEPNG